MTNAHSKHQQESGKDLLKKAVENLDTFIRINPEFSVINQYRVREDNVVLLDNNSFYLLLHRSVEKHNVRGSDGSIRTYIYDVNDGIYKTKNKNYILAPHIFMVYELRTKLGIITDMKKYWETYNDNKVFKQEVNVAMKSLHTGNHYRNKKVYVPKSVYG
jgi:hypothetical protein